MSFQPQGLRVYPLLFIVGYVTVAGYVIVIVAHFCAYGYASVTFYPVVIWKEWVLTMEKLFNS